MLHLLRNFFGCFTFHIRYLSISFPFLSKYYMVKMIIFISLQIIPENGLKKSKEVKTEKQNLVFLLLYFGHIENRISSMDFCSFLRLFLLYLNNCLLLELAPILYLYSIPVFTSNSSFISFTLYWKKVTWNRQPSNYNTMNYIYKWSSICRTQ